MKKITLFAITALSLVLTSCNKEQMPSEQENGRTFSMTLSASVNETKATMSDGWKFAFATGDKISLTNNQVTAGTYYELTRGSDGNFTGTVTAPSAAANWYAYYPSNSVSLAGQTGTQTGTAAYCALAGEQENVAADSKNLNITLNFQTAILVIDNKKGALDINVKTSDGKWVSGFAATTNAATFDVTKSDTEISLFTASAAGTHYVVVPAGVKIAIYDGDTKIKETKDSGLSAGKYYNISVAAPAPAISTIADVLATVDGGFPQGTGMKEPPTKAWVYGSDRSTFVVPSGQNLALIFYYSNYVNPSTGQVTGNATFVLTTTKVIAGENCYTATSGANTLIFNMTAGKLTSINFSSTNDGTQKNYGGTYDAFRVDLKMSVGYGVNDWNKITILIKGTDVVSGKYYFNESSDEQFANGVELNDEQIESINKAEGLRIVKEDLGEETTYQTVLVVSNSAGYSKTIVATCQTGQAPPL